MIVAFDTYYYDGYSYTVAGVFESWKDKKVSYFVTSKRECIDSEYIPGELYKRELPCIMQCLKMINLDYIDTIIVDGYSWVVDESGEKKPGLGKRLQDEILNVYGYKFPVVGIAKNPYGKEIPGCKEAIRGLSSRPLYITCTDEELTHSYRCLISSMAGEFRIPDIIKSIDTKTRSFAESYKIVEM